MIHGVSNKTNCWFWYDFFNENSTTFPCSVIIIPYIKTQVHLFKFGVKWYRNAQHPHFFEHETDKAHVAPPIPNVQFGAVRQIGFQ